MRKGGCGGNTEADTSTAKKKKKKLIKLMGWGTYKVSEGINN
jgi:hypothetical protein